MFAGPTWVGKEALEGDGVLSVHEPEVGPPLGQAELHHGPRTTSHRNAYLNKKRMSHENKAFDEPKNQCCRSGMFILDPGSDFFPSLIPYPNCLHPRSRVRIKKNLSVLTPKKWFLSSRKYDPGCSSRIPDPDADFYPSRIPGSKRHRIPDPDPQHLNRLTNISFSNLEVQ
jgi:hypothetical protein